MKDHNYIHEWGKHNAKSNCSCGHTGDGGYSQHSNGFQLGHGKCLVKGCSCPQFTWVEWTDKAKRCLELI